MNFIEPPFAGRHGIIGFILSVSTFGVIGTVQPAFGVANQVAIAQKLQSPLPCISQSTG